MAELQAEVPDLPALLALDEAQVGRSSSFEVLVIARSVRYAAATAVARMRFFAAALI